MSAPRDSPRPDESFRPEARLRRRVDFQRCYRHGRRRHGTFAILYSVPNDLGHPRIGITAAKRVGGAVVRIRVKRRIREIFRRWSERRKLPGVDLVVHLRPTVGAAGFREIEADLMRLMGPLARGSSPTG